MVDEPETGEQETGEREGELEKRVRKVLHLDPFSTSRREDGRFHFQLAKPPAELTPEEARAVLEEVDTLLQPLRDRAQGA